MSIVITLGNSYSRIEGLTAKQLAGLKKVLSYSTDPNLQYYTKGAYPTRRYLIDAKGTFATGLVHRVTKYLTAQSLKYGLKRPAQAPIAKVDHRPDFSSVKPYDWQLEAINVKQHRGIISAPTGTGKALALSLLIGRLSVRTLIVVPNLELKRQLTEDLIARFKDMSNIVVENIDSKALKTAKDFDCLIVDEAHHSAAKTYRDLNKRVWGGIYYRFFFTATPFRNDPEEELLFESIAGEIVYRLSYKTAIAKGYIVPVEAYYIEIPKQKTEAYTYRQVYDELVVNHETRNQILADLIHQFKLAEISTLTLVREIDHGKTLADKTNSWFANGEDDLSRAAIGEFSSGKLKALIGTTGIIGEGVDTRACEVVIVAGLGKAKSAFMQQVGRALRKYPGKTSGKVILVKDRSHKFLLRHFKEQCAILETEYGITPSKLE